MPGNPETTPNPEKESVVYIINKCWFDEHGRVLSVPILGVQGDLTNPDEVVGCVAVLNATEEARFGPEAKFFYSYKPYPRQLVDNFPFG